jgi:hypothetical protein
LSLAIRAVYTTRGHPSFLELHNNVAVATIRSFEVPCSFLCRDTEYIDVNRCFTQLPQLEYAMIPPFAFTLRHTQLPTHSEQQ